MPALDRAPEEMTPLDRTTEITRILGVALVRLYLRLLALGGASSLPGDLYPRDSAKLEYGISFQERT